MKISTNYYKLVKGIPQRTKGRCVNFTQSIFYVTPKSLTLCIFVFTINKL